MGRKSLGVKLAFTIDISTIAWDLHPQHLKTVYMPVSIIMVYWPYQNVSIFLGSMEGGCISIFDSGWKAFIGG